MISSRLELYYTVMQGEEFAPRGLKIREVRDLVFSYSPEEPFDNFEGRKYNVEYFKQEMLWKFRADPYDESIKQYAKMWKSVQNSDGTFNSNYGQYWFGRQNGLINAYLELLKDVESRRACIPMLGPHHVGVGVRDTVCTESITFHIRNHTLYMSVHMRSSDIIFGLGTDCPTFAILYRLMYGILRPHMHLDIGDIHIVAASSHIYERHFDMAIQIISKPNTVDLPKIPWPNSVEVFELIASCGSLTNCDLSKWLHSYE